MIRRYLCLPILLATASWFLTPTRAQQGSPPQHAPSERALRTSDSASRGAVAGGTPSVPEVEVNRVRISNTDDCAQMTIEQKEHAHFVDFAWDAFNVLNHANFEDYTGVKTSSTFSQPHTAYPARQLQVSVRYHF